MDDKYILDIEQHIDISRPVGDVFEEMLQQFTEKMSYPDGRSMNMRLERKPGGRWFRDLEGETGHLWGYVQTIKPPALIEIIGPMFMSYPVTNHLEIRVAEQEGGSRLSLRHRAFGLIEEDHKKGVSSGWRQMMEGVKKALEA